MSEQKRHLPECILSADHGAGCVREQYAVSDPAAPWNRDRRCQSDGGISVPGNHRCECMMQPAHEGRHGCHCGAMWGCFDCSEADDLEGCAACGAQAALT